MLRMFRSGVWTCRWRARRFRILRGSLGMFASIGLVIQGKHQPRRVPEASHAAKSSFGVEQGGTDLALDHLPTPGSVSV